MALFEKKTIIKNEINYDKLAEAIGKCNKNEIDYDKLAEAIVKASKAEEAEEMIKHEETMKKFREDYNIDENKKLNLINIWRYLRAFLEYGEEQSDAPVMTFELLKAFTGFFFLFVEIAIITIGFLIIGYTALYDSSILKRVSCCLFGFSIIYTGSIFRIARIEVTAMKDKERINIVFSSIMTLLSTVFAFISIIQQR